MIDFPPLDPGIEIVVASRGMSKGIAQTEGPQLVARPFVHLGPVQLSAQWKNVNSTVADGEGAASVSLSRKFGEFQLGLGVAHKFQTGMREATDDHGWELTGTIGRKCRKQSLANRQCRAYHVITFGDSSVEKRLVSPAGFEPAAY